MLSSSLFILFEQTCLCALKKDIAKAILKAQDIREESWDGKKYKLTDHQSARLAVKKVGIDDNDSAWAYVIGDLNHFSWNDSQYWAESILSNEE